MLITYVFMFPIIGILYYLMIKTKKTTEKSTRKIIGEFCIQFYKNHPRFYPIYTDSIVDKHKNEYKIKPHEDEVLSLYWKHSTWVPASQVFFYEDFEKNWREEQRNKIVKSLLDKKEIVKDYFEN